MVSHNHLDRKKTAILTGDIILVSCAVFLAIIAGSNSSNSLDPGSTLSRLNWINVLWVLTCPIIFYIFELYEKDRWQYNTRLLLYVGSAVVVTSLITTFFSLLFFPDIAIGGKVVAHYTFFAVPLLFCWRKIFARFFFKAVSGRRKTLLLGKSRIIDDLESILSAAEPGGSIVISDYSENPGTIFINGSKSKQNLFDFAREKQINNIVIANRLSNLPLLRKQLFHLKYSGVAIFDAPYFYETITGKVPVSHINDSWFLFRDQGDTFNPPVYRKLKKIIDKTFALLGIIFSAPFMLLAALAIKSTSQGPVLFKQERLGQNEQPYTLIKFRTMIKDAEKHTGPKWATEDDPRITPVGKLLRKTRIDELPQFINILKGDMSFVGPRPIRKVAADMLAKDFPYYHLRFMVKPGLTGWAQVREGYAGTKEGHFEKLQYDLYYVQNQSILFDLFITMKTIQTVLSGSGT